MMTVADTIGQFFTYNLFHGHFTRRAGCLTSRQQETKTKCVYGMFLFCFFTFTLYTMRSCSPSLRVVPSYLISFTKDKANIFSDLSLAVEEKRNTQAIKTTWLLVFTFETKTAFIYIQFAFLYRLLFVSFCKTKHTASFVRVQYAYVNSVRLREQKRDHIAVNHAALLTLQQVINKPAV